MPSQHPVYTHPPFANSSSAALNTSRSPPTRAPTRTGPSLRRGKTLTRPERTVAPAPLLAPTHVPTGVTSEPSSWDPWVICSNVATFWAPGFLLSSLGGLNDAATRQAWREKVTLCIIILILGGVVGFATVGLDRTLCPESAQRDPSRFSRIGSIPGTVGIRGTQFNISNSSPTNGVDFYKLAASLPGVDITNLFQRPASDFPACTGLAYRAASDAPCTGGTACPLGPLSQATFNTARITNTSSRVGYDWDQVANLTNYLVVDGNVLNMSPYLTTHATAVANDPVDAIIRTLLQGNQTASGKDATRLIYNMKDGNAITQCLTERYRAGHIDKITPGCFISNLFLYAGLLVILSLVLARFFMAIVFDWFLSARLIRPPRNLARTVVSPSVLPEGANMAVDNVNGTAPWAKGARKPGSSNRLAKSSRPASPSTPTTLASTGSQTALSSTINMAQIGAELFCVCLVTCYSEGEESLRTTLDSISNTTYSDDRKLLFVVADGMITGAGEKVSTPDICVSLLDADPRFGNPTPMSYIAVGSGAKKENRAMVYAGHYTVSGRRTPMVIVVKCGTEEEAAKEKKPGNRGKRDGQLILMNFFSRVTYNDRMSPLDFDLFRKIHALMGVTPDFFEVCLMVDADTKVLPPSLKHLVNAMQHDNFIMGVCGETRIANKRQSWVTAIQVYEYFISHHLAKAFESVFGGVTCLPGCFSMYRLKARKANDDDWVPLIVHPDIVREYSQSEVPTLHQKNLLLLGEDRFLTTILLRTFPNRKMMFIPQALCRTVAPDTFKVLLSQRRRWINSTIHNLMELVRVRNLCGTFCFSMQFVVFMDLLGTVVLPVAICLTYSLIISSILNPPHSFEQAIPLLLLGSVLGLPAFLILITTRKIVYVFWMFIYLAALPIWNFVLPVYSFWHFDDFSWGETRKVEGEAKSEAHGADAGTTAAGHVPLRRWEDWERSRLRKIRRDERRRRELARNYPGGYYDPNGGGDGLLHPSRSDDGHGSYAESDTYSLVSSGTEDDHWGTNIGAYNENNAAYPSPPATLIVPKGDVLHNAKTLGKDELEAMLDKGFSPASAEVRLPPRAPVTRYQLSETPGPNARSFDAFGPLSPDPVPPLSRAISPVQSHPTQGMTSAIQANESRPHVRRRSNGGGGEDWGPLGPLGPHQTGPPTRRI